MEGMSVFGVPVDFILFALTLLGVALFQQRMLQVALAGLAALGAKSVGRWLAGGWHVALAYVLGFIVMLAIVGWHPTDKRGRAQLGDAPPVAEEITLPLEA